MTQGFPQQNTSFSSLLTSHKILLWWLKGQLDGMLCKVLAVIHGIVKHVQDQHMMAVIFKDTILLVALVQCKQNTILRNFLVRFRQKYHLVRARSQNYLVRVHFTLIRAKTTPGLFTMQPHTHTCDCRRMCAQGCRRSVPKVWLWYWLW